MPYADGLYKLRSIVFELRGSGEGGGGAAQIYLQQFK
jgi:hypothetical protein